MTSTMYIYMRYSKKYIYKLDLLVSRVPRHCSSVALLIVASLIDFIVRVWSSDGPAASGTTPVPLTMARAGNETGRYEAKQQNVL